MARRGAVQRGSIASILAVCLAACSPLPALTSGTELSINTLPRSGTAGDIRVDTTRASDTHPAEGAAEGATVASGGVIGASAGLAASAACGLAIVVCAPIFMVVGGAAGASGAGLAVMASRGPEGNLGPDPLKTLAGRLAAYGRENQVDEQLRLVIVQKARPHWRVVPVSSRNSMSVQVTEFLLRAASPERISLEVRAMVRMNSEDMHQAPMQASSWPQLGAPPKTSGPAVISATFYHEGASAGMNQWMDDSGDFLRAEAARAYESIARQIIAALAPRPTN